MIKSLEYSWIIGITKVDVFVSVVSLTKIMLISIVTPEIADKIQRIFLNYRSIIMIEVSVLVVPQQKL